MTVRTLQVQFMDESNRVMMSLGMKVPDSELSLLPQRVQAAGDATYEGIWAYALVRGDASMTVKNQSRLI